MRIFSGLRLVVLVGVMLAGGLLAEAEAWEGPRAFDLGQVIVTATRTPHRLGDVPVAASVITREEIEAKNIKTVQDALIYLTGVSVRRSPGSWGNEGLVQMQGLGPRSTLILVDGQRVFGGHGGVDVNQISIAMVERIEVVRGPASALHGGDAKGGVINIITRSVPEDLTASVSMAFGSRATRIHEVVGGFREGGWGATFNFTHRETEGVLPEPFDDTVMRIFQGRLEYEFSPESKLTLKPSYSEQVNQWRLGAETQDHVQRRQGLNAIWEWQPDELSVLNLRGSWLNYGRRTEDGRTKVDDSSHEVELVYSRLLNGHTLTAGYHHQHHRRCDPARPFFGEQTLHSYFLQNEMDLDPFTLVLGARLDDHSVWGTETNPRINLLYRVTEALRLRASVGTAFRGPTITQLLSDWMMGPFRVHANPDLKPEESVGYQFGIEYEFSPRLLGKVSLFRNEVEDMISMDMVMVGPPPWDLFWKNIAEVTTQGIELSLASQLTESLTGRFGYTFLDTEDEITGLELTLRPNHELTLELNQEVPELNLNINLAGRYVGSRYRDRANTDRLDSFTTVDLALRKDTGEHNQVFVRLDNILGEDDIVDEFGLDGTEFLAGVKMGF